LLEESRIGKPFLYLKHQLSSRFIEEFLQVLDNVAVLKGLNVQFHGKPEELRSLLTHVINKHPELETLGLELTTHDDDRYSGNYRYYGNIIQPENIANLTKLFYKYSKYSGDFLDNATNDASVDDAVHLINKTGGHLTALALVSWPNTGHAFRMIQPAKLQLLQSLDLRYCDRLSSVEIADLLNRTGGLLQVVNFSETAIVDATLVNDSKLQHLKDLNFSRCSQLSGSGLVSFINKTAGQLETLNLKDTSIANEIQVQDATKLENLIHLDFSQCEIDSSRGLVSIINQTSGKLQALFLNGSWLTGDAFNTIVAPKLLHLRELHLPYCRQLTSHDLTELINKTGENLEVLILKATLISNWAARDISDAKLKRLKELDLSYCQSINAIGLARFISNTGDNLEKLNLLGTCLTYEAATQNIPSGKLQTLKGVEWGC